MTRRRRNPRDEKGLKSAYDVQYLRGRYAQTARDKADDHPRFDVLQEFVQRFALSDMRCLEIGCGRGAFQDIVGPYVGVDISEVAGRSLRKPFVAASATRLPFRDSAFDAVWSITTLEHIPRPGQALSEMRRVLRPGRLLYLAPAWFCRTWAAEGYAVRPYSDFSLRGKLVKATIPLRNSVAWRLPGVLLRRTWRLLTYVMRRQPTPFRYRKLNPSYDHVWTSDSDAINSMDPFEAFLWFISRGDRCRSHPSVWRAFRMRTGALIFEVNTVRDQVKQTASSTY